MSENKNNSFLINTVCAELSELSKSGVFEFISVEYKYQGLEQSGVFQVQKKSRDVL